MQSVLRQVTALAGHPFMTCIATRPALHEDPHYDTMTSPAQAASDHAAIHADLDLA